jgi:hypothetical protein
MINQWAAFGFLLVFYALQSLNCSRLRVIIDFQRSKIKPDVKISLCDATHENKYNGTIGRCGFPISVAYTAIV